MSDTNQIQPGTNIKEVVLDIRGEKLIQGAFEAQTNLFYTIESQLYCKQPLDVLQVFYLYSYPLK